MTVDLEKILRSNGYDSPEYQPTFEKPILHYAHQIDELLRINKVKAIQAVYDLIDQRIIQDKKEQPINISCRKGCSHCCKINVDITESEAVTIIDYCKKNKITIDQDYLRQQLNVPYNFIQFTPVAACVFLKDNVCSIYSHRPVVCRKHFVISDPKYCDTVKFRSPFNEITIAYSLELEIILSALATAEPEYDRMPALLLKFLKDEPGK